MAPSRQVNVYLNQPFRKTYMTAGDTTKEAATSLNLQPQSIRTQYSKNGFYFGIVPDKLPNGRLLWPRDMAARLVAQKRGQK